MTDEPRVNPDPSTAMNHPEDDGASAPKRGFPWKWVGASLAVAALFLAFRLFPVGELLRDFNTWVAGIGPVGYLLFVVVYIAGAVLFVPGSILTLGAGFAFGVLWGTVAVSLASTTAAALAFLLARYFLRERFERKIEGNRKFSAIDRAIGKEGGKIVFLLRLTPVMPFSLGNYLFGLTAVKFPGYVLASWIGMIPGTVLYVYIGSLGKTSLEAAGGAADTGQLIVRVLALAAIVAVTVVITRTARKALKQSELNEEQAGLE